LTETDFRKQQRAHEQTQKTQETKSGMAPQRIETLSPTAAQGFMDQL
jgi:hypothetical protein